jgi:hypothetical protein
MVDLLTPLSDPPARLTNDRNEFVQKMDQWMVEQKRLATEYNTSVDQLNNEFATVEAQASAATGAASDAATALGDMQELADTFVAIAAGGNIYATKAALTAALGTILEGQFALVLVDESQGNDPTVYQKSSGASVLKLNLNSTMGIDDISGLQTALDGKSATGHGHAIGDIADLEDELTARAPKTGPAFTGDIHMNGRQRATAAAIAASSIDLAARNHFTKTVAANTTFTFTNVPAGVVGFTVQIDYTSGTIAWPAAVKFTDTAVINWTAGKRYLVSFVTFDGGTTWQASRLGPFTVS